MKPISSSFGFWVLMSAGFFSGFEGYNTACAVFTASVVLFNALKEIEKKLTTG